jgi:hypothetical protein
MNVSAAVRKHWSLAVNQWSGGAASSSTNRTATSVWSFDRSDKSTPLEMLLTACSALLRQSRDTFFQRCKGQLTVLV